MNENTEEPLQPSTPLPDIPPIVPPQEPLEAILVDDRQAARPTRRRRRWLPIFLFVTTCFTTYAAGCYDFEALVIGYPKTGTIKKGETFRNHRGEIVTARTDRGYSVNARSLLTNNWNSGLIYMAGVMSILLFHEMGHFLLTLRYKVPASYPFFIPVPFMITGTMGAVIGMDPYKANRKEVFDIGLAGPLAGLVLTIPLVIYGIAVAKATPIDRDGGGFGDPLLVKLLIPVLHDMDQRTMQKRTTIQPL